MKVIGITGGVGSGKTQVLSYIEEKYKCRVIYADQAAHRVREPDQPCYRQLVNLLGEDILTSELAIDRGKMADKIFADKELLKEVNALIHPAVKVYFLRLIDEERKRQELDFLFIEAALLIEEGYDKIVDELWYVSAKTEVRRKRLKEARGYSEEKIDHILRNQLTDEAFRLHCKVVIDNGGSLEQTYRQVDRKLEEYL